MAGARLGLLSDAHGNPYGLEACVRELRSRGCDRLFFLGDAVGYLPMVEEVLACLAQHDIACQMGNHEAMLCERLPLSAEADAVYGIRRLRTELPAKTLAELAGLPTRRVLETAGRRILLLHGGPRDELAEYVYPDSDLSSFAALEADVVAVGHSHYPFIRSSGSTLVVGVGSCGLPRDVGNLAACAIYDATLHRAEIVRVGFDVEQVLAQARTRAPVHDSVVRCLHRTRAARDGESAND
jgi:predicted phosphodiesterase